jgi:hypothetical protein
VQHFSKEIHRDRRSRTQEALQTDVDGEHVDLPPTENHRVQESPYTRVILTHYARFGMETLDSDESSVAEAYDAACRSDASVTIFINKVNLKFPTTPNSS